MSTVPGAAKSTTGVTFPTVSPAPWILAVAEPRSVRVTSGTVVVGTVVLTMMLAFVFAPESIFTGFPEIHVTTPRSVNVRDPPQVAETLTWRGP